VNSHISYGITVWGGNSVNLEKVFRTQKKCIRSLFKIPCRKKFKGSYIYGHTKHLFTDNSLLTAHNLYNYSMISDAFKVIVSKVPVSYFETCYQVSSVNPSRLISSTCAISSLSSNFHHMIPLLWNSFMSVNRITKFSLCGFKSFKRSLKSFIVSMQSSFKPDEWHKFNNNLTDYCNYLKFQCLELPRNQPRVKHWYNFPITTFIRSYLYKSYPLLSPSSLDSSYPLLLVSAVAGFLPITLSNHTPLPCFSFYSYFLLITFSVCPFFLFFLFFGDTSFPASLSCSFFFPFFWLAWHVPHQSMSIKVLF